MVSQQLYHIAKSSTRIYARLFGREGYNKQQAGLYINIKLLTHMARFLRVTI